jgi:hypothetical protein
MSRALTCQTVRLPNAPRPALHTVVGTIGWPGFVVVDDLPRLRGAVQNERDASVGDERFAASGRQTFEVEQAEGERDVAERVDRRSSTRISVTRSAGFAVGSLR